MRLTVRVPVWAEAVINDLNDMHRDPQPVDASSEPELVWELPDDVRFEYAFIDQDGKVRADPDVGANGRSIWYPEVSEVRGPAYVPHPLADPPKADPPWPVVRHRIQSAAFGDLRRVTVVSPPSVDGRAVDGQAVDEPLPVVVLHDGVVYQRLARTAEVLAALVAQGRARPAHLAFVEPGDRDREYTWDPRHLSFVQEELRPYLEAHHAVDRRAYVAMGPSLGGLASATLAMTYPGTWSAVIAQAGAFLGTPDDQRPYGSERSWILERLAAGDGPGAQRWLLEVGTLDWLLEVNRELRDALRARGAEVVYDERAVGHNWGGWRDGLPELLAGALPVAGP